MRGESKKYNKCGEVIRGRRGDINVQELTKYAIIIIIVAVASIYLSGKYLYTDGGRISAIEQQLKSVGDKQQSVNDRLSTIESGLANSINTTKSIETAVDTATDSINDATERIDNSETGAKSSAELIRQCKQILANSKQRNEK